MAKERIPSPVDLRVVGLTFNTQYPAVAWRLQDDLPKRCRLVREPTNPYDKHAIAVVVYKRKLGHLSRNMAKLLAPELDRGIRWRTWVTQVVVHLDNPDQPGIWIHAERV